MTIFALEDFHSFYPAAFGKQLTALFLQSLPSFFQLVQPAKCRLHQMAKLNDH